MSKNIDESVDHSATKSVNQHKDHEDHLLNTNMILVDMHLTVHVHTVCLITSADLVMGCLEHFLWKTTPNMGLEMVLHQFGSIAHHVWFTYNIKSWCK